MAKFSGKIILGTLAIITNGQTTENSFSAYVDNFRTDSDIIETENKQEDVPIIQENSPFVDFEEIN